MTKDLVMPVGAGATPMQAPPPPRDPEADNKLAVLEAEVVEMVAQGGPNLAINPRDAVVQAHVASRALYDIIESKKDKVVVNGKTYLTFEDWQVLAHFYGYSTRITSTDFCNPDGMSRGYQAHAELVDTRTGFVIGGADGMCMDDEVKWRGKPLYAIRSMSQTRACAKALRQKLAFVAIMAGYQPTPAEEVVGLLGDKE